MIALVRGEVAVRRPDHVVVDVHGVGWLLSVSAHTLKQVPAVGREVTLLTHMVVREDVMALYGFATEEERELFLLLLGVQSVGPKMALAVLSGGSPRELVATLAAGDVKRLTAVPGIGKRTAERIVVELREKVVPDHSPLDGVGVGDIVASRGGDDPRSLAREGLLELGFTAVEAEKLLAGATGDEPEDLIAHALRAARP